MSLVEINWNPDKNELRKFGLIALIVLMAVSLILKFAFGVSCFAAGMPVCAGLIIFIVSLVSVKITRIIYLGLTFAALPIGIVINFVLLALFYFLILTPVGIVFKISGRDAMSRKLDSNASTYWSPRQQKYDARRYFHQS
jgi:hypothetical protein